MSDIYKWWKIADWLADVVMIGDCKVMEWKPHLDMNQSLMVLDRLGKTWKIYYVGASEDEGYMCELGNVVERHSDPKKAVCLAVVKQFGDDISEFRMGKTQKPEGPEGRVIREDESIPEKEKDDE